MRPKPTYKRRHYFVKKEYQLRFILKFCAIILLGAAFSSALLIFFSRGTLTSSYTNSHLTVENTARAILPAVLITNVVTLVLISAAAIAVILFISHKIAGPLFRFEKELKLIGEGDLTRQISLRRKDQLKDMAASLNTATGNLRRELLEVRTAIVDCHEKIEAESPREDIADALNKVLEQLTANFKL